MNVLLKEAQPITSLGLKQFLQKQFEVKDVVVARTLEEAKAIISSQEIDLCIVDSTSAFRDTAHFIKAFKAIQQHSNILIYGDSHSERFEMQYIKAGASGFVTKDSSGEDLILAIQMISHGKLYLSQKAIDNIDINQQDHTQTLLKKLSKREQQVFKELMNGNSVNGISEALNRIK